MKKISTFSLILGLSLLLASCSRIGIKPSGAITKQQKAISGFTALDVSSSISVYVNFSDSEEKVEVEANENLHAFIEINKIGRELEIGLKPNTSINGNAILRVYVTTKNINKYSASGAS